MTLKNNLVPMCARTIIIPRTITKPAVAVITKGTAQSTSALMDAAATIAIEQSSKAKKYTPEKDGSLGRTTRFTSGKNRSAFSSEPTKPPQRGHIPHGLITFTPHSLQYIFNPRPSSFYRNPQHMTVFRRNRAQI
jgi:hypothetical protein